MPLRPSLYFPLLAVFCIVVAFGQDFEKEEEFTEQKLDSNYFHYKRQLEWAKNNQPKKKRSRLHWELGDFYYRAGVYSEAMLQFKEALALLDDPKDTLHVVVTNAIGEVELSLKNYKQAEFYFNEALQTSVGMDYQRGQALSNGLLGSCLEKEGIYPLALNYQEESLELFTLLNDSDGLAMVHGNIGSIYEDLAAYDLAKDHFNKAYALVQGKHTLQEVNILNNLGDVQRKKGKYKTALAYTQRALQMAKALSNDHQMASANKDLSKTYALLEDHQKAYLYLQESNRIKEQGFYAQNTNQFNLLQTVFEADKKEARIALLLQENKLKSARQKYILVLVSIFSLVLLGVYAVLRKRRKTKLQLKEYEQRLLKTELEKKAIEEKHLQKQVQLKTAALSKYSLHLSQKNKILHQLAVTLKNIADRKNMDVSQKLKVMAHDIDQNLEYEKEWQEFTRYFSDIHPDYIQKLAAYPIEKLSPAELRLGMLLRLNLSTKEIASVLRITPDSIRVARHRLRKKLGIDQKEELIHFLLSL